MNRHNGVSVRTTVWEPWMHMETIMMPRHEEKLNKSSVSGEREGGLVLIRTAVPTTFVEDLCIFSTTSK